MLTRQLGRRADLGWEGRPVESFGRKNVSQHDEGDRQQDENAGKQEQHVGRSLSRPSRLLERRDLGLAQLQKCGSNFGEPLDLSGHLTSRGRFRRR